MSQTFIEKKKPKREKEKIAPGPEVPALSKTWAHTKVAFQIILWL